MGPRARLASSSCRDATIADRRAPAAAEHTREDMQLPTVSRKRAVAVVYVLAIFMQAMDITIVNVALATLARQFHVTPQETDAVAVSFVVSLAVFIPASGWLGDRFGTKRVLLFAVAVFTAASALCGLSQTLAQLVVFRALQGVGGGLLMPVGMAMLFRTYPPAERIRVARYVMIPAALGPALGPVLGGLLTTDLSWRWVFYVNLPIGIFALVFGLLYVEEHREPNPGRFDLPGFLLAGLGFSLVMFAISEGANHGWASPLILTTGLVGAVLLCALVLTELRVREPMLDLRLFGNRLFRTTTVIAFVAGAAFFGILYLFALYFQDALGMSPLVAGLTTFPEAIGVMLGSQVSTRMVARYGPRATLTAGLLGITVLATLMSFTSTGTNWWVLRVIMFFVGVSVSHVFVVGQAVAFTTISSASTGRATTLYNAIRQLGAAVGIAGLATVLGAFSTTVAGIAHPDLAAYHIAMRTSAAIALIGAAFALTVKDRDAAAATGQYTTVREAAAADGAAERAVLRPRAVGEAE